MGLNTLTLLEAIDGLKTGKFTSRDIVSDCLGRIREVDAKLKCFVNLADDCIKEAKEKDELIKQTDIFIQKPLLGIPISVKDNYCTKGLKTTASSNVLKDYIPPYDATVVSKLRDAGAIIAGKTNMDAWAHGSSTETSDFFTTRNPWNTERLPGGSSGGSAASVASDEVIVGIGSETAGSIRQPASWCGTVGLKPTYGRVSRYGVIAMGSSLDCPGPITKTVGDAAYMLNVMAGSDGMDATASERKVDDYGKSLNMGVKGMVIGVSDQYLDVAEKEIAKNILESLKVYEKLGAKIKKIDLFNPKYAIAVYTILQRSEVSSNLGRYDGVRYGEGRESFGEEAKRRIMLGTYCLSAGYYDAYYLKAQKVRTMIIKDFERAFKEVDVIIAPTTPSTALPVGSSKNHPMFGEVSDVLVEPSTIAGLPGLNINSGFDREGLPIGMQIIGPQFSESLLLRVGKAFEKETNYLALKPKI